jgi:hypothetical protein
MVTIKHSVNFVQSTVTIVITNQEGQNWDVREYAFSNWKEMKLWISTVESTLALCGEKYTETIVYAD